MPWFIYFNERERKFLTQAEELQSHDAGDYVITFRMYDSSGAYTQVYELSISVEGDPEPEALVLA